MAATTLVFIFLSFLALNLYSTKVCVGNKAYDTDQVAKITINQSANNKDFRGKLHEFSAVMLTIHCSHLEFLTKELKNYTGIMHVHLDYDKDLATIRHEAQHLEKILNGSPDIKIFVDNYRIHSENWSTKLLEIESKLDKDKKSPDYYRGPKRTLEKKDRSSSCTIF